MKTIKNINNNVSLCLDHDGNEVIVFGSGVGFIKPPSEVPLSKIQRTFYDVNPQYLSVISQLDSETLDIATDIIDYANRKLKKQYTSNVILTLADHIQFAIQRKKESINIKLPLYYEVKSLYPDEMKIGAFAISLIQSRLDVTLPMEEAASITLHLINYGSQNIDISKNKQKSIIAKCTEIVEEAMEVKIDKKGFNYLRFASHMYYLVDRLEDNSMLHMQNEKLLDTLKEEYPKTYECALKIRKELNKHLEKDEIVYIILHINRLCDREDCS